MLGLSNSITGGAALDTFDLSSVSSLQAWFKKGEGITTDGGNVSAWVSQVGNLAFTQPNSAKQPVHNASTDVIQFSQLRQMDLHTADGLADRSVTGGTGNAITVCVAMKLNVDNTNVNTQFQHILKDVGDGRVSMYLTGDFFFIGGDSASATMKGVAAGQFTDDEVMLVTWSYAGGTDGAAKVFKNTNTTQLNDASTVTAGAIELSQLGDDGAAGGRGVTSGIIEIAIFNEALENKDLERVLIDISSRIGV